MARADDIGALIVQSFPGTRVTSTTRTRSEQDALIAAGKTKARNSQHLTGNGLDIVLPKGVTPAQVRSLLTNQGINPGEFLNESGRGSGQGTAAHLHIGLAPKAAKGGGQVSADGGSTFDRAQATRQRATGPSMQAVYDAYQNMGKPGGMTRQEAAQFEQAVNDGHVMLPRGAGLRNKPAAPILPAPVVAAYNSHAMDDDPEARAEIEQQLASGAVSLPKGMRLQKPKPRTMGERLGMGARGAFNAVASLPDLVAGSLNSTVNSVAGTKLSTTPFQDLTNSAADALGAPKPESDQENLVNAAGTGLVQGIATAGLAAPLAGMSGATGVIARGLSSSPLLDAVSGASAGASQESARQAGAGPVAQIAAGLLGGAAPIGLVGAAERIRAPKDLPAVVAETPRAAVIDEQGNLTPHGQDIAARHGATPEQVHAAYDAPPSVKAGTANDQVDPVVAREATTGEPAPTVEPTPVVDAPTARATPEPTPVAPEAPLPATALERVQTAKEFGVDMSRGQATKNFDIQDREQRLRNSNGPEAEQMRQFTAKQTEQVKQAVDDFKAGVGDTNATPEARGRHVQEAVRELRNIGQNGVSALYKQAKELGQEVPLDTASIRNTFEGLMAEADIPDGVKRVMEGEAARYGLIGKPVVIDKATGRVTNEANVTTVKLDDGQIIKFRGEPQTLRLDNAEDFRKVISKQYQVDGPQKLTQELKRSIDDATEEAAVNLAKYGQDGAQLPEALKTARAAHVEQVQTFKAKDIVQSIADWKKGAEGVTSTLSPEDVMKRALGKTSDLKRVKAVLLSKATVKSKAAWKAIQAHGLATIMEKATTRNANIAGEITDTISGAKLRSAIEAFGTDKLKVLLEPEQFNTMMRLRKTIEDVTIPITGTTNPAGSGTLLMRLAKDVDNQVTAAFGSAGFAIAGPPGAAIGGALGRTISPAIKAAKEAKAATETLKGAAEYTPERAATDTAGPGTSGDGPSKAAQVGAAVREAGAASIKTFINIYGSPRVIAPVLATTAGSEKQ